MPQEHNRSLEVIVESPPHIMSPSHNNNYHQQQHQQQQYAYHYPGTNQHASIILSSQNGNIKSLQSSLKKQHTSSNQTGS